MNGELEKAWAAMRAWLRREPPPRPVHLDVPIEHAVKDAEVLLAYAAQSQRSLKEDLISRLCTTRDAVASHIEAKTPVPPEKQSKFWFAYDELAVAMAPLSAHSIRSSLRINVTRFPSSLFTPPAVLAVVAIVVFFLCIVIQSFWVTGKDVLDKADAIDAQRVELQKKLGATETALRSAEAKQSDTVSRLCTLGVRCDGPYTGRKLTAEEQTESVRLAVQSDALRVEVPERRAAFDTYTKELADLNERGQSLTDLLKRWHTRVTTICGTNQYVTFLCLSAGTEDKLKLEAAEKALTKAVDDLAQYRASLPPLSQSAGPVAYDSAEGARIRSEMSRRTVERARLESAVRVATQSLEKVRADVQRQTAHEVRIILGNLATYIVPLFMGLLGSLAFVLQTLTTQLREHTYVQLSASASVVRLCLGAIAGVFGGLAAPASEGVLKGLPPLFIPFVFGYGIEILFSLLNKIVRTFTQGDQGRTGGV